MTQARVIFCFVMSFFPAPNTASLTDFWRMIWQEHVETIVMLTNIFEGGKVNDCVALPDTYQFNIIL